MYEGDITKKLGRIKYWQRELVKVRQGKPSYVKFGYQTPWSQAEARDYILKMLSLIRNDPDD